MSIPNSVTRAELTEALRPLCELLGTSDSNVYDIPGMNIGLNAITFLVPTSHEQDPGGFVEAVLANDHPQAVLDGHIHEVAYVIHVRIEDGL